jgi:hypothetical protein
VVVLTDSLVLYSGSFSLQLHYVNSLQQSVYIHAVLGGDGPRWQPLNGADRHALLARRKSERVLAGGNSDGGIQLGIQLQQDGSGAHSSARKRQAVATAERHRFSTAMDTELFLSNRFCTIQPYSYVFVNIRLVIRSSCGNRPVKIGLVRFGLLI